MKNIKKVFLVFIIVLCCSVSVFAAAPTATFTPTPGAWSSLMDFPITNGAVYSLTTTANYLYVGGLFSYAGNNLGQGLALDSVNGNVISGFPQIGGGAVNAAVSDGAGGWFVGGEFTNVAGLPKQYLAHIYGNGALDPLWNPNPNGKVNALCISGTSLYVTGNFYTIGGINRYAIAKLDAATGAPDAGFNAAHAYGTAGAMDINGADLYYFGPSGMSKVNALTGVKAVSFVTTAYSYQQMNAIKVNAGMVYLGGEMVNPGGYALKYLMRVDAATGTIDASFTPNPDKKVDALLISGAYLYAGGGFASVDGYDRKGAAKISLATGEVDPLFDPDLNGSVFTMEKDAAGIFLGGDFSVCAGEERNFAAKVNPFTGQADPDFIPNPSDKVTVFTSDGTDVFMGGRFASANGFSCQNAFRINQATAMIDTSFDPQLNGVVYAMAANGADVFIGGDFTLAGGIARGRMAKFSDASGNMDLNFYPVFNSAVYSLLCSGQYVYAGGQFYLVNGYHRMGAVKLNASDGIPVMDFYPGISGSIVYSITEDASYLYFAGAFNSVRGITRNGAAKTDKIYGIPEAGFNPDFTGNIRNISFKEADLLYGGSFSAVSGQPRNNFAIIESSNGQQKPVLFPTPGSNINTIINNDSGVFIGGNMYPRLHRYYTGLNSRDMAFVFNSDFQVNSLAYSVSGNILYVGGDFTTVNNMNRPHLAAVNISNPMSPTNTPTITLTKTCSVTRTLTTGGTPSNTGTATITRTSTMTSIPYYSPTITVTWTYGPPYPTSTFTPDTGIYAAYSGTFNPNGPVYCITQTAGDTYVGGAFQQVGMPGKSTVVNRFTGATKTEFPYVSGGGVYNVVPDGSGGWYIAGDFTKVAGIDRDGIAHIFGNGALDPAFVLTSNGLINSLFLLGDSLYAGGNFTTIGGIARTYAAKINPTTGAVDTSFSTALNGQVVRMTANSSGLFITGHFTTVNGIPKNYAAKLNLTTGALDPAFTAEVISQYDIMAIITDGTSLYIGGRFETINGIARNRVAKLDCATGAVDSTFITGPSGYSDEVRGLACGNGNIYAVGGFVSFNGVSTGHVAKCDAVTGVTDAGFSPDVHTSITGSGYSAVNGIAIKGQDIYIYGDFGAIGGLACESTAKLNAQTGMPDPLYNLNLDETYTIVNCIAADTNNVFLGGNGNLIVNPEKRSLIVKFNTVTGVMDPFFKPNIEGSSIRSISINGGDVFVSGNFSSVDGLARPGIAKLNSTTGRLDLIFNPVMDQNADRSLYYGGGVYVSGTFTLINGIMRHNAAKLDPVTGALVTAFDPEPNNSVIAIVAMNGSIYLGGTFTSMSWRPVSYMAKVDSTTGVPDMTFNPDFNSWVRSIIITESGRMYAGGTFNMAGGLSRGIAVLLNPQTGEVDPSFDCDGNGSINVISSDEDYIYIGANNNFSIGATMKSNLARVDALTGALDNSFAAYPNDSVHAFAYDQANSKLCLGGGFSVISGVVSQHYAEINLGARPTRTFTPAWSATYTQTMTASFTQTQIVSPTVTLTLTTAAPFVTSTHTPEPGMLYASAGNIIANATVNAIKAVGSEVYFGGNFSFVGPRTGHGVVMDPVNGNVLPGWPEVSLGTVKAAVSDGSGGWYIGGDFKYVAGQPRSKIAHIFGNGALDPYFNPPANGIINALLFDGNNLYAGGNFTSIGGQDRAYIAKLDPSSGNAIGSFNAYCGATVTAIASEGANLFIAGDFYNCGFQARSKVAKISTLDGGLDASFAANVNFYVYSLLYAGGSLFIGGQFSYVNGLLIKSVAKVNSSSGAVDPVFEFIITDMRAVYALAYDGTFLYAGGDFGSVSINGQIRTGIVKINAVTGAVDTAFNPVINSSAYGREVYSLALTDSGVYAGGNFVSINSMPRYYLARFDAATGSLDTVFNPGTFAKVRVLSYDGTNLFTGGDFACAGIIARNKLAKINSATGLLDMVFKPDFGDASKSVLAIESDGTSVYAGGNFTTVNGAPKTALAKFDALTGVPDAAFSTAVNYQEINSLYLDSGRLYAGGYTGIFKLDPSTAVQDAGFNVVMSSNKRVSAIKYDGANLIIGGSFNSLNSVTKYYLAKVDASTGANVAAFSPPAPTGGIFALGYDGASIYAGGGYGYMGTDVRNNMSKVGSVTGTLDAFNPNMANMVTSIAFKPGILFAGGNFLAAGGAEHSCVARIDPVTGAVDPAFTGGTNKSYGVQALELSPSGDILYIGGQFTSFMNLDSTCFAYIYSGGTATPVYSPTISPTWSVTQTPTITQTWTITKTFTVTRTQTVFLSSTITPDYSPTITMTPASATSTRTLTVTFTPSVTATLTPAGTSTVTPLLTPVNQSLQMLVFPNPATNGEIKISILDSFSADEAEFAVYTRGYRLIRKFSYGINGRVFSIPASGLGNGIYVIKCRLLKEGAQVYKGVVLVFVIK